MKEKKLVTPQELALVVLYLNKAEARDKIYRAIQCGSKFLSNGQPGTAQNVDKSTSLARKVFCLFKFVNDLHGLISPVPQGTPLPLVLLGKSKKALFSTFLFLDQIVWLGRLGIYKELVANFGMIHLHICEASNNCSITLLENVFKDVKKHTAPPVSLVGQAESYLRIIGEPKLPSVFLQVTCWVLGEYGTADGKFCASYITGKLCDVAEAYSNGETVKAYAVTSLMKISAFEIAAGRKVDMLPECQSLIEELSASHSTDLQQCAYELQAVIGLDARAVEIIMPSDASCEDIEIDKNLSFLDGYVQQAIEKGAQPYISENERSGMLNISNFRNQGQHEASSMHSLRFEAYELPKPSMPSRIPPVFLALTTELVPVPEPSYLRETQKVASSPSVSNADPSELRLRLDGVQKKWGRPTYSSSEISTSSSTSKKQKPQVEISPEKQKLAASLFGGSSKTDKRGSTVGHKAGKASSHAVEKPQTTKVPVKSTAVEKIVVQPPPDLLDLGETTVVSSSPPSVDPFKQLEGLIEPTQATSSVNHGVVGANKSPDLMGLYVETAGSGPTLDLLSAAYLIGNGSNYNEMVYKEPTNGEITTSCNIVTISVETGNEIEAVNPVITDQGSYSSLNLDLKS
ncbi:hypothetical protein Q3G72_007196 [Acer saccharum]|nr:hypothetical protein Q3G72_007196 [Acer saccharum]